MVQSGQTIQWIVSSTRAEEIIVGPCPRPSCDRFCFVDDGFLELLGVQFSSVESGLSLSSSYTIKRNGNGYAYVYAPVAVGPVSNLVTFSSVSIPI